MNPDELSALAGIMLSLSFSYIPGIKDKFSLLDPTHKRLGMLACLCVSAAGVLYFSCSGIGAQAGSSMGGSLPAGCDRRSIILLLRSLLAAIIANQATFSISPKFLSKVRTSI